MSNLLAFVVEDSPVIQENLIAALEELAPVKVVGTAVDQAGALHWLTDTANRCDIAIIDIFLRQGSGMGVLRELHAAATLGRSGARPRPPRGAAAVPGGRRPSSHWIRPFFNA